MTWTEATARPIVNLRSGELCECCHARGQSIHHRKHRSQGGTWDPANLLRLCGDGTRGCHGWIEHHPEQARAAGLVVPSWADPAVVPALIWPHAWWRAWWQVGSHGEFSWVADPDEPASDRERRAAVLVPLPGGFT